MSKYKEDIIRLRKNGKSYNQIKKQLGCSLSVISHHCKKKNLGSIGLIGEKRKISDEKKKAIRETYKNETAQKTAEIHNVSESTVKKYGHPKNKDKSVGRKMGSRDTCKTGDISEQKVKLKLVEERYTVSEPINSGSRYDLIADDGDEIYKVQVKTAYNEDENTSIFQCCSNPQSGKKQVPYTEDEVDVYCCYSPKYESIYWIPFDEAAKTSMTLRHVKTPNGQTKNINWSEDYKI